MKTCKSCKGKGWLFQRGTILTGKYDSYFGIEIPRTKMGTEKITCTRCFGNGLSNLIETEQRLETHLKVFKLKLNKEGYTDFQLYPMFCTYYERNKERYRLPKETVIEMACEILI